MMTEKAHSRFIEEPTECPCCEYPLVKVNDQLFCKNTACSAQLSKKLEHFCKTLGIKGMGPKTIEKLQLSELTEIFYMDETEVSDILGAKIAAKLLDEIERAKTASLEVVLASFSIPLIGDTASKKLCKVITDITQITPAKCKEAGLGEKATANVMNWLEGEYLELREFLPFTFQNTSVPAATGKTVCITGKLSSYKKKADAEDDLRAAGFTLVDSVTKTTDYLVDEENGSSAKRLKAEKYGIIIITDLSDLLKETTKND